MIKIMRDRWNKNEQRLREVLAARTDLNRCDYDLLVRLTFENIFNLDEDKFSHARLDLESITTVDNGHYQGTLLFVIPFDTYQPSEYEYIMTYIGYGSCSGCDALQAAQAWSEGKLTDGQLADFMLICKDLVCNAIKPYNSGWRNQEDYEIVEEA